MATTRYAKQPKVGEALFFAEDDRWPVLAVHDHGLRIDVRDRIGRVHHLVRADKGVWLVVAS